MNNKLNSDQINIKFLELGDKRAKERYKAPLVLLAHISYKTQSGKVIRTAKVQVGRCFSKHEAIRLQQSISNTLRTKQVGYGPDVQYIEEYAPALKANGYDPLLKENVYEHITRLEILSKEEYLKGKYDNI